MSKHSRSFRLASMKSPHGPCAVAIQDDLVYELQALTGRSEDRSMLHVISEWPETLPRIRKALENQNIGRRIGEVEFDAPIGNPGGLFCAGANYKDHTAEMARKAGVSPPQDPHLLGLRSWHFLKTKHCIAGPGSTIALHPRSNKVDWEAELAVIIGRRAYRVKEDEALNYVFGFTVALDLSARDLGRRDALPDRSSMKFDWVAHKNWDGSCPIGPWIVLAEDIDDPHDLRIALQVNGVKKQDARTQQMIFSIQEQIADLSNNFTLHPGDIILTGTPAGVGAARGEFLNAGDLVTVEIEKIGELAVHIGEAVFATPL